MTMVFGSAHTNTTEENILYELERYTVSVTA
jgi:hypothetical protein